MQWSQPFWHGDRSRRIRVLSYRELGQYDDYNQVRQYDYSAYSRHSGKRLDCGYERE